MHPELHFQNVWLKPWPNIAEIDIRHHVVMTPSGSGALIMLMSILIDDYESDAQGGGTC